MKIPKISLSERIIICVFIFILTVTTLNLGPGLYNTFSRVMPGDEWLFYSSLSIYSNFFKTFLAYFITFYFGKCIIEIIFKNDFSNRISFLSCFPIGYIFTVGLLRILSIFNNGAVLFSHVIIIFAVTFLIRKIYYRKNFPKLNINEIFWFLFLFIIFSLIEIYAGDFRWVGHGPMHYPVHQMHVTPGNFRLFPIILQHYDEFLYNYWSGYYLSKNNHPTLNWWLCLSFIKASGFLFLYQIFINLNFAKIKSFIVICFIFFGTTSINLFKYYLLFDSSNPLAYVVFSTRAIGIIFIVMMVAMLMSKNSKDFLNNDLKNYFFPILILLGIGISASSISCALTLIFLFLALYTPVRLESKFIKYSPILFTIFSIVIYSLPIQFIGYLIIVYMGTLVLYFFSLKPSFSTKPNNLTIYLASGILIGMLTLGNITSIPFAKTFLGLGKPAEARIINFPVWEMNAPSATGIQTNKNFIDDFREGGLYSAYNQSSYTLIITSGLWFLLLLGGIYMSTQNSHSLTLISHTLALLPGLYIFIDFLNIGDRSWIKTRFLECLYYASVTAAILILINTKSRLTNRFLVIFLALACVFPILGTERMYQLIVNANFFMRLN
jgi:hypothetical protein